VNRPESDGGFAPPWVWLQSCVGHPDQTERRSGEARSSEWPPGRLGSCGQDVQGNDAENPWVADGALLGARGAPRRHHGLHPTRSGGRDRSGRSSGLVSTVSRWRRSALPPTEALPGQQFTGRGGHRRRLASTVRRVRRRAQGPGLSYPPATNWPGKRPTRPLSGERPHWDLFGLSALVWLAKGRFIDLLKK